MRTTTLETFTCKTVLTTFIYYLFIITITVQISKIFHQNISSNVFDVYLQIRAPKYFIKTFRQAVYTYTIIITKKKTPTFVKETSFVSFHM